MHIVAVVLAVATGVLILLGYLVPALQGVQSVLLGWVMILAGTAAVIGVFNLVLVHANRISNRERGAGYSAVLLISLFISFMFGLVLRPDHPYIQLLINAIVVPAEASLMALLAISLLYASVRLLRRRQDAMSIVFLATAILMLVASATLPFGQLSFLNDFIRPWFQHVWALGGARGILIGVGLGTLATGLRILLGVDRPYGAK
jgi:hypothetical protein